MTYSEPANEVLKLVKASGVEWTPEAQKFCDEACIQRYLRARNGDVMKAANMLQETIKWRKQSRIDELTLDDFSGDLKTGFIYVAGNDSEGRSIVVLRKRTCKLLPSEVDQYLRYLMFTVESAVRNMKNGAEQWVFVIDLNNYSPANSPALSTTSATIQMLQDHYPEHLGKAYIVNAPTVFEMFYGMLSPFMDPKTKTKVEFVRTKQTSDSSGTHRSSSWGSFSSLLGGKSKQADAAAAKKTITISADASNGFQEKQHTCNSSNFSPLLKHYWSAYQEHGYRNLLREIGW